MKQKNRIGVLCYSLMPATADLLNRLAARLTDCQIKAFPIVMTDISGLDIRFYFRSTSFTGRFWVLKRGAPDGQLLSVQLTLVCELVKKSDLIILLGLQSVPALLTTVLARILNKPVLTINQTMPPAMERKRSWLIRWPKKFILRMAQLHVSQTKSTDQTLQEVYGLRDDQLIYAPFDGGGQFFKALLAQHSDTDRNKTRKHFQTRPDALVFLFVGTLIYLKGVDVLINAFAKVCSVHPNSSLWVVGADGRVDGQIEQLRAQAQRLGIREKVLFIGPKTMNELVDIYRGSDVFILPTRKDVWPKVLVEAALAGLPLITTPATGCAHTLVQHEVNGFVVPVDDIDALADAMHRLTNAQTRKVMGDCSLETVQDFIKPEIEADKIVEAIHTLLKEE